MKIYSNDLGLRSPFIQKPFRPNNCCPDHSTRDQTCLQQGSALTLCIQGCEVLVINFFFAENHHRSPLPLPEIPQGTGYSQGFPVYVEAFFTRTTSQQQYYRKEKVLHTGFVTDEYILPLIYIHATLRLLLERSVMGR